MGKDCSTKLLWCLICYIYFIKAAHHLMLKSSNKESAFAKSDPDIVQTISWSTLEENIQEYYSAPFTGIHPQLLSAKMCTKAITGTGKAIWKTDL